MTKSILLAAALMAATTLAACEKKQAAEAPAPAADTALVAAPTPPAAATDMSKMAMPSTAKMAKGVGTVTAVNAAAGTVTLDHQAIPAVEWPAMVMVFKAAPPLLEGVKVGDKIAFDLKVDNGVGELTTVQKQ